MRERLPIHPRTGLRAVGIVNGRAVWPILGGDETTGDALARELAEIDTEIERVRGELVAFADLESPDDEALQRFTGLETELTTLGERREPVAHRAEIVARARESLSTGRGTERANPPRSTEVMNRVQPFADLDRVADRSLGLDDVRSRALSALENVDDVYLEDAQRERAERLLRTGDRHGRIARHFLLTGSDEYARAFESILSGVKPWALDADAQRAFAFAESQARAINEGTNADGGFLVPFYLDPTVILTNAGSTNPFRQISDVATISTNKWHGVSSAGVTAGYRGEAEETTDASPTFAQPEVDLAKADAYLQASFESMQDTSVVASFGMLLADAKDNFEAKEMAVGDGAAGHMQGVITAAAAVAGSKKLTATAATFAIADVWALRASIKPRYRRNLRWVAEQAIFDKIRQFATGSGQQAGSFWTDLGGDTPAQLIGKPVDESSEMDSTVVTGKNILAAGDFKRGFKIIDRIGMSVQYEPLVKGPNQRPTGEAGWYAYWRVGSDLIVPDAVHVLQVQ